jgi:hypothetical protein
VRSLRLRRAHSPATAPGAGPAADPVAREARFAQAAAAGQRGDYAVSEQLYDALWRDTGSAYFRVRALESRRLRHVPDEDLRDLARVSVGQVIESLSEPHAVHLLARRIAIGDDDVLPDLPAGLLADRELQDGIGKRWERTGEVPRLAVDELGLAVAPMRGIEVTGTGVVHAARPLTITPSVVLHSDSDLPLPGPYDLTRLAGGWAELHDVFAMCESNAFVGRDATYVDEYRSELPPDADPRTDPLVRGVRRDDVGGDAALALGPADLEAQATARGLRGFWLAGRFGHEWGHWVNGHLTRIPYLRTHPEWGRLPLIVQSGLPPAFVEFLDLLAPGVERIELAPDEVVHLDRVIVSPARVNAAPNRRYVPEWPMRHVFAEPESHAALTEELRGLATFSHRGDRPRRVMVSRDGFGRRGLTQRAEFESIMRDAGFVPVHFERMSAAEQVGTWLDAELVVGEAGSWMFLSSMGPDVRMLPVSSGSLGLWWTEFSTFNALRREPVRSIVGQQVVTDPRALGEFAAHGPWTLSPAGLTALADAVAAGR